MLFNSARSLKTAFLFGCLHNFNLGTETKLFHISQKPPEPKLLAYETILLQFPTSLTHLLSDPRTISQTPPNSQE